MRVAGFLIRIAVRVAYPVGTIFRRPYLRFIGLQDAARRDLARRRYSRAEAKAAELLALAEQFPHDWDYGNAIHHGHLVLGRIALVRGDVGRACRELVAAGHTPGSPQLNSFGPNCQLALELLRLGQVAPVLEFLQLCAAFWNPRVSRAAAWRDQIPSGATPDFCAKLGVPCECCLTSA